MSKTDESALEPFREFCEWSVPDALAQAIDQVKEEWDGSPFIVLAIPEHANLDVFLLTGEAGTDRLADIVEVFRGADHPPVAAALASSMPLFTTSGFMPGEGMLAVFAAHETGAAADNYWRLYQDEEGSAAIDELPDDVVPDILRGATTELVTNLVVLSGDLRADSKREGSERWDELLATATEQLNR